MTSQLKTLPGRLEELRKMSGYEPEEVAKKLNILVKDFLKKERSGRLSLEELKKLANIYKVPMAAFFSEILPKVPDLVDYRLNREKKITPEVYLAKRRAIYLSEEIKEISGKITKLPKIPSNSPYEMACELRKYLKVNVDVLRDKTPREILEFYKDVIEEKLNIIVIEYPLGKDVRAFSIYSDLAVIVINESDEPSVKLFSLFHELGHLFKNESGLCSIELESENEVERFCNEFSAEFLVPTELLKSEISLKILNEREVKKIARRYGVSVQVIMLKLLKLRRISFEEYREFKEKFDERKLKKLPRKDWERTFKNRNGKLVISEVRRAYMDGKLSFYEAMKILDLKVKYAEKILG